MSQMTLKIKKVGMKNPKTKVLGFEDWMQEIVI